MLINKFPFNVKSTQNTLRLHMARKSKMPTALNSLNPFNCSLVKSVAQLTVGPWIHDHELYRPSLHPEILPVRIVVLST